MLVPLPHVIQNQHILAVSAFFFHVFFERGDLTPPWSVYLGKVLYALLFRAAEIGSLPEGLSY